MINVKVEVSTGLHAGASWLFHQGEVAIGGNAQADVFLCDDSLPDECLRLKFAGGKIVVSSLHDSVNASQAVSKKSGKTLLPGQTLDLDCQGVKLRISVVDVSGRALAGVANGVARGLLKTAETMQGIGVKAVLGLSFASGLMVTTTILFFGSASVSDLEASQAASIDPMVVAQNREAARIQSVKEQMRGSVASELAAFGKEYAPEYFDYRMTETGVRIEAELNRIQTRQFERLLSSLSRDYGEHLKIEARVELSEEQRLVDEIEIKSVTLGRSPVVVLRDGKRLFVGANHNGLRLTAVDANRVVFAGNSSYELPL